MRNIILLSVAALSIACATPASAQYRHGHGGHYHGGGGGGWVAPLVGGMVLGGVLGAIVSEPRYASPPPVYVEQYPYRRYCRTVIIGRDYYSGRPIYGTECE